MRINIDFFLLVFFIKNIIVSIISKLKYTWFQIILKLFETQQQINKLNILSKQGCNFDICRNERPTKTVTDVFIKSENNIKYCSQ